MNKTDLTKKNTYIFSLPATYIWQVDADSEEEAREMLEKHGGIDILGELGEIGKYCDATLEETWEGIENE